MALLLVPLAVILVAYVAFATAKSSRTWADALVRWLADLELLPSIVVIALGKAITELASWISNRLGRLYLQHETRVINWVGALGHYVQMTSDLLFAWPIKLVTVARWLVNTEIPRLIHALPNSVTRALHNLRAAMGALERDAARLTANLPKRLRALIGAAIAVTVGPFLVPLRWLLHHWRKIAHAAVAAGGVAIPWIYMPKLLRGQAALRKRVGRLEKVLGVTAAVALLARALQVSTRCIRTGNIGKGSRAWCAADSSLVDGLLGDVLAIAGVISVVEFAEIMLSIESEAVQILSAGIQEFP